jgi:hypothetical protein
MLNEGVGVAAHSFNLTSPRSILEIIGLFLAKVPQPNHLTLNPEGCFILIIGVDYWWDRVGFALNY